MRSWELVRGHMTPVVLFRSVSPNHVLVDSLCSVRVFKLFSRSIHYNCVELKLEYITSTLHRGGRGGGKMPQFDELLR